MDFLMPKLDHLSEEATIVEWLKEEGDSVKKDEVLLRVETNKTELEVKSDRDGILKKKYYEDGDEVPVLSPIAEIA